MGNIKAGKGDGPLKGSNKALELCRLSVGAWLGAVYVGVVAGLVKVANGQTDRLARILWLRGH